MRGGSVRLTRAVRQAACGEEPEEKLSEWRQQTADKSDLFILVQKKKQTNWEDQRREQRRREETHKSDFEREKRTGKGNVTSKEPTDPLISAEEKKKQRWIDKEGQEWREMDDDWQNVARNK